MYSLWESTSQVQKVSQEESSAQVTGDDSIHLHGTSLQATGDHPARPESNESDQPEQGYPREYVDVVKAAKEDDDDLCEKKKLHAYGGGSRPGTATSVRRKGREDSPPTLPNERSPQVETYVLRTTVEHIGPDVEEPPPWPSDEQTETTSSSWRGSPAPEMAYPPGAVQDHAADTPVLHARVVERDDPQALAEEVRYLRQEMEQGLWIPHGEDVVPAEPMEEPQQDKGTLSSQQRRRRLLVALAVLIVIVVAVVLGVVLGTKGDDGVSREAQQAELLEMLRAEPLVDNDSLDDPETPQSKAMAWLLNNTNLANYPEWQRLQRFALATLYFSTGGDNWYENREWLTDEDVCGWYNMDEDRCNDGGNLAKLTLQENNLNGTLPKELGVLSDSLVRLVLDANSLVGTLPSEIGLMRRLEQFFMSKNSFTGTIPSEIGSFKIMKEFFLEKNEISGTIPTEIGNMAPHLGRILFGNNLLNGTLPTELGLLPDLQMLRMENNDFTGTLPSELGLLTKRFAWLNVQDSALTGSIPNEIGNLVTMEQIELQNNRLNGTIPEATLRLPELKTLTLYNNSLTGNYTCAPTVGTCMISCDNSSVVCRSL